MRGGCSGLKRPIVATALLLVLSSPFWELAHPVWEVDDARYAEVPREMAESGDWITPTLNAFPYVEKPPLLYWLTAASYRVFGVSEASARLPLALVALAGLAGVLWLGAWLYSLEAGLGAALILGTCLQFFTLGHLITPDLLLTVCLLWCMGLILRGLSRPEDARWAGPLAWAAMAAAFLSKGLVGILFPGVWTGALLALFPPLRKGLRPLALNWGLPASAAVLGAWLLTMEWNNPGFLHFFLLDQHFDRYFAGRYNRPGPPYYFIGVELVGTLPWTPLLLAAVLSPLRRWKRADPRDLQLALWVLLIFAFFSVSSSKLITYILPLFPQQALLGAQLAGRLSRSPRLSRWVRGAGWALGLILLAAGASALTPWPAALLPADLPLPAGAGAAAAAALALTGAAVLWSSGGGGPARLARVALLACLADGILLGGSRLFQDRLSGKALAGRINERAALYGERKTTGAYEDGAPLRAALYGERNTDRASEDANVRVISYGCFVHAVPYYTGLPVDIVNWAGEMAYAKRFPLHKRRFGDDTMIRKLPTPGVRTFVILKDRELAYFLSLNPQTEWGPVERFGPWVLVEF